MKIVKHIPNTLTSLNLVSGCIAIVMAFKGDLTLATVWIAIGAAFDFSDGFAARLLNAKSPIGKELDSLTDCVTFGVAPGIMIFQMLNVATQSVPDGVLKWIPFLAFFIPVFSALRLAKFNLDERQTTSFIGLPVPANALFWAPATTAVFSAIPNHESVFIGITLVLIAISSYLMVSEIPMFSLKIHSIAWKGNEFRYILVICAILFISVFGLLGVSGTIVLYILLSLFNNRFSKVNNNNGHV